MSNVWIPDFNAVEPLLSLFAPADNVFVPLTKDFEPADNWFNASGNFLDAVFNCPNPAFSVVIPFVTVVKDSLLLETFLANSCFCVSAPALYWLYLAIISSFAFICFSKFSIIVLFAAFDSSVAPNACCTAFNVLLFAVKAFIVPWLVADKFSNALFNPSFDVCNDSTIVFTPVTKPGVVFPFACVSFNPFNTCASCI